ncbi:MAG TPA: cation:proton antiporter [Saprospiraceae bacterium]|nr:cation:proton antiporter [Saprospiraceae bacterium]HMP25751.1 cation:proton antiporter [Saprospiraceae bacterium]
MDIPLLQEVVIILGLSAVVIYLFQRFRLPSILGLLLTGVIVGPGGLALIGSEATHEVEMLAEIGVILLLFIIGLEFSLKTLASIQRIVLIGGAVQVGGTILATYLTAYALGYSWGEAIFLGFLFSLSSTAIVLKILQESGEINSPHGKIALAILIFQDIIVVPMMLFTPLIAGNGGNVWQALLLLVLKAALVIGLVLLSARFVVPRLLHEIARTRSRELFILSIIVICFAVAWATSQIGLSLALGAFMAGLIISESEYSHQATGIVIPFREIFTSFFFVSIGMLLDVQFFVANILLIVGLMLLIILVKALIAALAAVVLRYPLRTVLLTALSLFQIGEFAFILSMTGIQNELLAPATYQYFLAISILSMAITPFVMGSSESIVRLIAKSALPRRVMQLNEMGIAKAEGELETDYLKDHVIVIGYGVTGQNVARAAKSADIPYVIIELNPETVRNARDEGEPIHYGDAMDPFILEHLKVYSARVAVIAIHDLVAAKAIVTTIRSICQTVHVIVRTRAVREMEDLYHLGANEVIPEEFETSVEIFTRLLQRYLVPQDEIEHFIQDIRTEKYEMLRTYSHRQDNRSLLSIPDINVTCLKVQHKDNDIIGRSLADSNIRAEYGVSLLAIQRENTFITDIQPVTEILQDDLLYVVGTPESISGFNKKLKY